MAFYVYLDCRAFALGFSGNKYYLSSVYENGESFLMIHRMITKILLGADRRDYLEGRQGGCYRLKLNWIID